MNSVHLIGNLATDVEVREVGDEKKTVAGFLLAVDRSGRDSNADFFWVSVWERQAELCAEYLSKGSRIAVDGRLRSRTWQQDGQRRDAVDVVARRVEFLQTGRRDGTDREGADAVPFEAVS